MMGIHKICSQGDVLGKFYIGNENIVIFVHFYSKDFSLTDIFLRWNICHVFVRTITFYQNNLIQTWHGCIEVSF